MNAPHAPSGAHYSLKLATLRWCCDPSAPFYSFDAVRRWLSPSKARRWPVLWWTTPAGGLVQSLGGGLSWGMSWARQNRFCSGLRLRPSPWLSKSYRSRPPLVASKDRLCTVVRPPFFKMWRERRHFWLLIEAPLNRLGMENRLWAHFFQGWFTVTSYVEEMTIGSSEVLSQSLAVPRSSSCLVCIAAVYVWMGSFFWFLPATFADATFKRSTTVVVTLVSNRERTVRFWVREKDNFNTETEALYKAGNFSLNRVIWQAVRLFQDLVSCDMLTSGTRSKHLGLVFWRKVCNWHAAFVLFDGTSQLFWEACHAKPPLIVKVLEPSFTIPSLSKIEVNLCGTGSPHGLSNSFGPWLVVEARETKVESFGWDPGGLIFPFEVRLVWIWTVSFYEAFLPLDCDGKGHSFFKASSPSPWILRCHYWVCDPRILSRLFKLIGFSRKFRFNPIKTEQGSSVPMAVLLMMFAVVFRDKDHPFLEGSLPLDRALRSQRWTMINNGCRRTCFVSCRMSLVWRVFKVFLVGLWRVTLLLSRSIVGIFSPITVGLFGRCCGLFVVSLFGWLSFVRSRACEPPFSPFGCRRKELVGRSSWFLSCFRFSLISVSVVLVGPLACVV